MYYYENAVYSKVICVGLELTLLSENEYERLSSGDMTPAMAARYLQEGEFRLRGFDEVLRSLYPKSDIQQRLSAALLEAEPASNPESVGRTVRNWINGHSKPTRSEDVFRIAFALDLSEAQTNRLLGVCTDYGIHYRNGRDVVYAWFLRTGGAYTEARDFFASLPELPQVDEATECGSSHITRELQNAFLQVHSTGELRECYIANLDNFGALHRRAYGYFRRYLDRLIHPVPAWTGLEEPDYSMEAIMELYFSMSMPSSRSKCGWSVVQRLIKYNWPNTTALKNIRNRKADVPRKLLLLLYVITENVVDGEYRETDEDYLSPRERLDDHWFAINAILTDCGMPPLDPRNATDWLVLYAVTATEESMSERMEKVIEHIFAGQ